MRCETCVLLLDEGRAEQTVEQFLAELTACDECPEMALGSPALLTTRSRLSQCARVLRKVQSKLRQREQDLAEARQSATQYEARIANLESIYKQSTHELEPQVAVVARQAETIRALSAPVLEVGEGVLAMPIIGSLDEERAETLTGILLENIHARRTGFAILDLTGLEEVDATTARILLRVCGAIRLLGAELVLCGLKSGVALGLVRLGSDLSTVQTLPTLMAALKWCQAPRR